MPISKPAVVLGIFLAISFTALNCYIGLRLGWLVCVSLPATVFSLRLLHGVLRLGNAREAVLAQTIASASHAITLSSLFILPALLLSGSWTDIFFWPSLAFSTIGGGLGIFLASPLHADSAPFPEARACEVALGAEEKTFRQNQPFLMGVVGALLLKWQTGPFGTLRDRLETMVSLRGYPLYLGAEVSAAAIAVGAFLKAEMSLVLAAASALGWWLVIPWSGLPGQAADLLPYFWKAWNEETRYLGVGAMIPAGIWAIVQSRDRIVAGLHAFQARWQARPVASYLTLFSGFAAIVVVEWWALRQLLPAVEVAVAVLLIGFLLTAVASHLVGILGLSLAPLTSVAALAIFALGSCVFALGMAGDPAVVITLIATAMPLTAAITAASLVQDFRIGQSFGIAERELRLMKGIGVVVSAATVPIVLKFLHQSVGIGTGQPGGLIGAPAGLMSHLARGIFHPAELPLKFLLLGAVLGVIAHGIDQVLALRQIKFRIPVMVFAAGLYLPFPIALTIAIGGTLQLLTRKKFPEAFGILLAAGLLLGDALGGLIQAAMQALLP